MYDLEILLLEHSPDLAIITETWCNKETSMAVLNFNGYHIDLKLRQDRTDTLNGIGGGLLVYLYDGLLIWPRNVANNFNQFLKFEVSSGDNNLNLNIKLVYRPPSSNDENTEELCKLLESTDTNSIIIGVFNFPKIDWKFQTSDRKSFKKFWKRRK